MKADQTTSLYVDAPPLALFSVLSDLENRPKIIRNVKRTHLKSLNGKYLSDINGL